MINNLPFVIIQIVGIAICLFLCIYVALQKPSNIQKILIIIACTCLVSFVGYLLELVATDVTSAMFGCVVGYVGKPFSLLAMLCFLLEYCGIKYKKRYVVILFLFFVFLSTMVFTNQYHNLYYTSVEFNIDRPGSGLVLGHGVFWYVYMVTTILIFIMYSVLIFIEFKRSLTRQAKQMCIFIFLTLFFGIAGLIGFITGITGGYDATLAGTLLGSICILVLLVKYRLFDTLTLAKEKLLSDSNNGLVVIDARSRLSFYNKVAEQIFPELEGDGSISFKDKEFTDKLMSLDVNSPIISGDNVYQISIGVIDKKGRKNTTILGKTIVFNNITIQYNYAKMLHSDVEKVTAKIKGIQRSILISFADLVEARDGYTGTHVKNVSYLAKNLAIELGKTDKYKNTIDDEFISMIEDCAPLHDVGKIKIPDAILGKRAKLTHEEFEIMKTHTLEGGKIIDQAFRNIEEENYVDMSKDLVTCHHEWFDGSGYPYGLKGEEIPLSARIMAVADVYDALRMERPYKPAYSKAKSIEIMKSERGNHFDPEILDVFLATLDKWEKHN